MKKININTINSRALDQKLFVAECNEKYEAKLRRAAEHIASEHKEKPILLLSGPSGSGKTTSCLKIDNMLDEMGLTTHTISMDNYFLPKGYFEDLISVDGKPDYESPLRIDIDLLSRHMEMLAECEEIEVPGFDFSTQSRTEGFKLKRGKDDIIAFEGIHALNPQVTGSAGEFTTGMYVSVRTRIELSDGALVHPCYIRVMRRLIRDELYRGRGPAETFDMFESVQRGENRYILPYKQRADGDRGMQLDTFLAYEPSLYKTFLLDKIRETSKTYKRFKQFEPVLSLLEEVEAIDPEAVDEKSLPREFIGGSFYTG